MHHPFPEEYQDASRQALTRYCYADIVVVMQEIKDVGKTHLETVRDAQFILSLYEQSREQVPMHAHAWACMPIPKQVQILDDLLHCPVPRFQLGGMKNGEGLWPLDTWQIQLTELRQVVQGLRRAIAEYNLYAGLERTKDYWRAWLMQVEQDPDSWDSDFSSCSMRRDLHEKIREVYPRYIQACLADNKIEATAYGLIINNLDSHPSRATVRKWLQDECVDNPHLNEGIRSVIAAFLREENAWFRTRLTRKQVVKLYHKQREAIEREGNEEKI